MLKFLMVPALLAAGLVGVASVPAQAQGAAPAITFVTKQVSAMTLLDRLKVQPKAHSRTYSRARFKLWIDANGDGENTRTEVLKAESLVSLTTHDDGSPWMGLWDSPYDGRQITSVSKMAVDHLVPLKEAWASGAWKWSAKKREAYANDLGYGPSLIAVSAKVEKAKGNKEPSAYLPSVASYRCTYVRNWIAVKSRWGLSVDAAEKADLRQDLTDYCTSMEVRRPAKPSIAHLVAKVTPVDIDPTRDEPSGQAPVVAIPTTTPNSIPTPSMSPTLPVVATPITAGGVYYANCDAVRAANAAPLYSFEPGYRPALDADDDGIACEDSGTTPVGTVIPITSTPVSSSPVGSGAICRDGSVSSSAHRSGTCSHHGGVSVWL